MVALRSWARSRRVLALCLLALTIVAKVLVPQGYMVVQGSSTTLNVALCSGVGAQAVTISVPAKSDGSGGQGGQSVQDPVCPFSALGHAAIAALDLALLLDAIAFVLAVGLAPRTLATLSRPGFLTPPLRGPPAFA
jgi:hypothetical protein